MAINPMINSCKNSLNNLFNSINTVFLHLQTMPSQGVGVVLIKYKDIPGTGRAVEYWILRDYTITEPTTTVNTSTNFTIEFTIIGQGVHGLALVSSTMSPEFARGFIANAASDAAAHTPSSENWTSKLIGQSIFFETGSLRVAPIFNVNGELEAKSAIGLNTVKFDDDTVIMDEIDKNVLDQLIHWTNGYAVISH